MKTKLFLSFGACLVAVPFFTLVRTSAQPGAPANAVLAEFDKPFTFGYLAWEKATAVQDGVARIQAEKDNGGLGMNGPFSLAGFADHSPRLRLRLNEGNKADRLGMVIMDQDGTNHGYEFDLSKVAVGQFVEATPVGGASLSQPGKVNEKGTVAGLDLANIKEFHVQGTWRGLLTDISLDRIDLAPPNAALQAQRLVLQEDTRKEEERRRNEAAARVEQVKEALAKPRHPATGPQVLHVGAVAPDILGIDIQARKAIRTPQVPYVAQPGDEIQLSGEEVVAWVGGKPTLTKSNASVTRQVNGQKVLLGDLATEAKMIKPPDIIEGEPMNELTVDLPEAYSISSPDDPNFARPTRPLAVYRKSKANDLAGNDMPMRHQVYLKLPRALRQSSRYDVNFSGVNTRQASVAYRHEPPKVRSEAVHVSHIGYRPNDPFKRAFLSVWLGTGGAHAYANPENLRFQLLDEATGKSVFKGAVQRAFAAEEGEPSFKEKRSYSKTNVYSMDFSAFSTPGRYRVLVEGIGTSYPFPIAREVWGDAFKVSMAGLLHHRSGIELGPPFTEYKRPRTMHPADGFKVFQLNITRLDGEADKVNADLQKGTEGRKLEPDAWGGYMDAGDWDRRSQHLSVTYDLLELFELFPAHFKNVKLALPPSEARNTLPDILDEARWNLDFYKRLQLPDGGVRGGIEQTAHPRPGETSWQESLVAGVFAPDAVTSAAFAANAAKMARLLAPLDARLAAEYRASALKAWDWAEKNGPNLRDQNKGEFQDARNQAAVEMLWLSREPRFDAAFRESTVAAQPGDAVRQHEALFTYARLPDGVGDAALKQQARAAILALADVGLRFAEGNSFGITSVVPQLPPMAWVGYFSTPEMISAVLPRAHFLSGDAKYLRGAVQAANFSSGANPENMAYTIGIGPHHPRAVLHVDSKASAQPAPKGITVYGPSDPAENYAFDTWVYTWFLNRSSVPNPRTWPASESYVDLPNWPSMTEYTVQQNIGPTAYYWGYLAARGN